MRRPFHTTDVFTTERFGGNPLAVLPRADGLDALSMQRIAREFNLSETVFVLPPEDPRHTRRIRIFTPTRELPFAGHPTIGTALVLAWTGEIPCAGDAAEIVFEEGAGPVPVRIALREGCARTAQLASPQLPERGPEPPPIDRIAAALGLEVGDVCTGAEAPRQLSCGVPYLLVALTSRRALARAAVDVRVWEESLRGGWAPDLYVFYREAPPGPVDVHARMFGPGVGIIEDPATGSAVAPLAAFLADLVEDRNGTLRWTIEQGRDMGRPSRLELEADLADGAVRAVRVGGAAVPVSSGELDLRPF